MIFTKTYIREVIAEEIKNATQMKKNLDRKKTGTKLEFLRRDLLQLFIQIRHKITSMSATSKKDVRQELQSKLESLRDEYGLKNIEYGKFFTLCIHILDGKVDPQLVTFIKTVARNDRQLEPYMDKIDSYGSSVTPEEEKYQPALRKDPDPGFMRVPKTDNAIDDQEDLRKDRKTLVKAESKQLDEGLLQLAKEIGEAIKFLYKQTKEVVSWTYAEAKKEIAKMNLTHDKATKAMEEWKNMKRIKIMFDEDPEVKELIEAGKATEAGELMVRKGNLTAEDQVFVKNVTKWMRSDYLTGKAELAKLERRKKAAEAAAEKKAKLAAKKAQRRT